MSVKNKTKSRAFLQFIPNAFFRCGSVRFIHCIVIPFVSCLLWRRSYTARHNTFERFTLYANGVRSGKWKPVKATKKMLPVGQ